MIVTIHQPNYIPWIGYFHKMMMCDTFVILDNVQFSRRMFFHRTKIKSPTKDLWLTVPVHDKYTETLISDLKIDNSQKWKRKHLNSIFHNYKKSSHFEIYYQELESILTKDWQILSQMNSAIITWLAEKLDIDKKIVFSSKLNGTGKSTDLLIDLCIKTDASTYISGPSGKNYLDESKFDLNNIKLLYHKFIHPEYKQLSEGFSPYMSVLDLLFNHGSKSSSIMVM